MNLKYKHRPPAWLVTVLVTNLFLTAVITTVLISRGESLRNGIKATAYFQIFYPKWPSSDDSWTPMLKAYRQKVDNPTNDMYDVFFKGHTKFQYPPPSILIFDLFSLSMTKLENNAVGGLLLRCLSWMSRAAVLLIVLLSVLILEISLKRYGPAGAAAPRHAVIRFLLVCVLSFT